MSGGEWDYFCYKLEEVTKRLSFEKCEYRRALGARMVPMVEAMKAVEWVDSFDRSPGDEIEPIKAALGDEWAKQVLAELLSDARRVAAKLEAMVENLEGRSK